MSQNALAGRLCCPGPRRRSLQRSPNLLTGFERPLHDGKGKRKEM